MDTNLYLIALIPPEKLRDRVRKLKMEMNDTYNASHALKAPAHITLQMPFRREPGFENRLTDELRKFSHSRHPFTVNLERFDAFPPRVIFIRIADHSPIEELHASLKSLLRDQLQFPDKELMEEIHPHMTIATRDLSKKMFHKAWPEFKDREFEATFTADHLHLLKHTGKHWGFFREFPFEGKGKSEE